MKQLTAPIAVSVAVLGVFSFAAVRAQEQQPPTPPPTPAPPTAPATPQQPPTTNPPALAQTIEPAAQAILDKMFAAYAALQSYSANTDIMANGNQPTGKIVLSGTAESVFLRPNRVLVRLNLETKTGDKPAPVKREAVITSDGKTLYVTDSANKAYAKAPLPAPDDVTLVKQILINMGSINLSGNAFFDPTLKTQMLGAQTTAVSVGEGETIDGVSCDLLTLTIAPPPQNPAAKPGMVRLSVGKVDGLLRRVMLVTSQGGDGDFEMTETYRNVKANPAPAESRFAFVAPAGYKLSNPDRPNVAANPNTGRGEAKLLKPAPAKRPTKATKPTAKPKAAPMATAAKLGSQTGVKVGASPASITGPDLAGKTLNLSSADFKGKVVLVDFWATWCGPCMAEMPALARLYAKYRAQGFEIVGISLDLDKPNAFLADFVKKNNMPWRQVFRANNGNNVVAESYGVEYIPYTILVGRDGKIAAVNIRGEATERAVQSALAKK